MCLADEPWLVRELLDFPFSPTPLSVIKRALSLVHLKKSEVFADLGCGEANVLIHTAERFNVFCVGFEIDRRLIAEAKRNIAKAGLNGRVDVVHMDLFTVDLSRFDVLYVYPFPTIASRLSEKMHKECRKSACAIAYRYPLHGLNPAKTTDVSGGGMHGHKIFVYKF
jgi:16S rRNA A1518/A1519 N6-dimethyltransferase RsmA/KsgA/DIM1 with predicted DNA glycosylase/AP lyase activity